MKASECLSQEDAGRLRTICKLFNAQEVILRQDQHFPEPIKTFQKQYTTALIEGKRVLFSLL